MRTLTSRLIGKGYLPAFWLITSLFFLWGFSRSLLDVLNRHFQDFFSMSILKSTLVQGSTYIAYALAAIPAGILITRGGYRKGIVTGLSLFGLGAFLFIPGGITGSFELFIVGLFIIGCGLASLETSANPYIAGLGSEATSASRLNLAQSFNGMGSLIGPVCLGTYLFSSHSDHDLGIPYGILGAAALILALVFIKLPLPHLPSDTLRTTTDSTFGENANFLWKKGWFIKGYIALFVYEIAEIGMNSMFLNYAIGTHWLDALEASELLSFGALGLFMIMRISGSFILRKGYPFVVLATCSILAFIGATMLILLTGWVAHLGLFIIYASESIMFPTIFALVSSKAGKKAPAASAFMMTTPLGGAVGTIGMGFLATHWSLQGCFVIPACSFLIITLYAITETLRNNG